MVWRILKDPKALNKRLYKEVTEAQLTAVLIITVRNSLGWEVNTVAPVETVGNILSSVLFDIVISTGHPRVNWVADQ